MASGMVVPSSSTRTGTVQSELILETLAPLQVPDRVPEQRQHHREPDEEGDRADYDSAATINPPGAIGSGFAAITRSEVRIASDAARLSPTTPRGSTGTDL
jgi:hypothetical protein